MSYWSDVTSSDLPPSQGGKYVGFGSSVSTPDSDSSYASQTWNTFSTVSS